MTTYRVADWMSTPPIVVSPRLSLADAARLMEQWHVRRLPVVEHGRLIGIVTLGDLRAAQPSAATTLSVYEWHGLLERVTVKESMTKSPQTVTPDTPVLEAAQIMLINKFGGLPVVEGERVVGLITESDLLRLLMAQLTNSPPQDTRRELIVCAHCGALLRRRSLETIDSNDTCWRCHYHIHRCEQCRHFDGVGCLLDRAEQHSAVRGQHCDAFSYRRGQAALVEPIERISSRDKDAI